MDDIPRLPSGKVLRRELKARSDRIPVIALISLVVFLTDLSLILREPRPYFQSVPG